MNKIAAGIASMAMIVNMALPLTASAASTELLITGNGSDSTNTTTVAQQNSTVVSQTNNANITNNVSANSSSGNNSASKNTGGDVTVGTGDSQTVVSVENTANSNVANVEDCNCDADASVTISENGADSENNAVLGLSSTTTVAQSNNGSIENNVGASSHTGGNKADRNTGGSVEVTTGNSITNVGILNEANSNVASVGGHSVSSNGDVSLWITGNGADSENNIGLLLDRGVLLQQRNSSYIENNVDADSSTGWNHASRNTGGSVSVDTGDAHTGVLVDNATNFNWANIDCDCLTNVTAKIAGNGDDASNTIEATLSDGSNVFQDNSCESSLEELVWGWDGWNNKCGVDTNIGANSTTGLNHADRNVGDPGDDPEVTTGDSETLVGVENTGNSNMFGTPVEAPEGGNGGVNVNISFNLGDLLGALGIH